MKIGSGVGAGQSSKDRTCFQPHFLRTQPTLNRMIDFNKLMVGPNNEICYFVSPCKPGSQKLCIVPKRGELGLQTNFSNVPFV